MNRNLRNQYVQRIQNTSDIIAEVEASIGAGNADILKLKQIVTSAVEDEFRGESLKSIEQLRQYYKGVEYFLLQYGDRDIKEQIGQLFGFRPEKLIGEIYIKRSGPFLEIVFSEMRDFLAVKFAKRKETFTQDDRAAGFFKVLQFEGHQIPVCVAFGNYFNDNVITHEMTHFRHNIIGMDYYSGGGGIDAYEQVVYDDLQEEILAFFSEGIGRAEVQLAIAHDPRYYFYRRLEDSSNMQMYQRFMKDVASFISIAREVKEIRPKSYLYDLALIPIKKWRRYLKYLQSQKIQKT